MALSHASAVGLSVPDADDITAWIRSPDYPSYESRADSGEMRIPAASGPGDVLYYFVSGDPGSDRFHEVDFRPVGVPAPDNGISVVTTASASPMPKSAWPRRHASEGIGVAEGVLPGACGSIHVLAIGLHCPEESPGDPPCEYRRP